jgi:hypothetical protein
MTAIPGPQHQLVVALVNRYPELFRELAQLLDDELPAHDRVQAAPNTQQAKRGESPMASDTTVHCVRDNLPVHFAHVEMQNTFTWSKFTDLRAYHGSEVRNTGCGGRVIVLSPDPAVTRRYREAEAQRGWELVFAGDYLSSEHVAPFAEPGKPFRQRALAAAIANLKQGPPPGTAALVTEMYQTAELLGDLFMDAMVDLCPPGHLEAALTTELMEKLESIPKWKARVEQHHAEGLTEGLAQSLLLCFESRNDSPSEDARARIRECDDPAQLQAWQVRAYRGETSAQIFGEDDAR